jgi:outer membrane protein TolC
MNRTWVWLLLLVSESVCWCQGDLTLDQAVNLAVMNNRRIHIAQLEVSKSEDAVAVARTYRLPSFRFNLLELQPLTHIDFHFPEGSLGTFPATGPIPMADTTLRSPLLPVTLFLAGADQPLSQLRRIRIGVALQELNRQLTLQRLRREELAVANEAKKAYYALLQTQSALEATEEALKLFRELERVANESLAQQAILQSDVLEVQTRLAQTELDQLTLRNALTTQRSQLNLLLGRSFETEFNLAPVSDNTEVEIDKSSARARALEQRPELGEARLKVLQAERDRSLKQAEAMPDVSLSFNYLAMANIRFVPTNTVAVGLQVNWSVFDWGRRRFELASKDKTTDQAKTAVTETEAQIALEVDANRNKLEETRARLKVSGLTRKTAAEKLRVTLNRRQEQAVQIKDVLQMQVTLAESNHRYQQDLLAYWGAKADFEKAIGDK